MVVKVMSKKILKIVKLMVSLQMGSRIIQLLEKGLPLSVNIKTIIILLTLRGMMILPLGKLSPFTNYVFYSYIRRAPIRASSKRRDIKGKKKAGRSVSSRGNARQIQEPGKPRQAVRRAA